MLEKKVNIETSADSSGTTCDIVVCLIVSSTLVTDIKLGQARPIYTCFYLKMANVSLQMWML